MSSKTSCDVIVIGGGSAALETGIAARQAGAESVVLLEKAPKHESGGNAQFSHVGFRFVHSGAEELRGFFPQVPEERRFCSFRYPEHRHALRVNLGANAQPRQGTVKALQWHPFKARRLTRHAEVAQ